MNPHDRLHVHNPAQATKMISPTVAASKALVLYALLSIASNAGAAAIDDIKVEVSQERCEGFNAADKSYIVYASNLNPTQLIDANFKYDSVPAGQHFLLFDLNLNPSTDRFPKFHPRRLAPREAVPIGCTSTYRASLQAGAPLTVPIVVLKQNAAYVDAYAPDLPPEDARTFAAYTLRGGIEECAAQGAKPPGLLYLVNLHPYVRLSASFNLLDERGNRISAVTADVAPLSGLRAGCSNAPLRAGPITDPALQATAGVAINLPTPLPPAEAKTPPAEQHPAPRAGDAPTLPLVPLSLGTIQQTQNVCSGSVPTGWIKINDAWNPTVCGNPTNITYNVWTIEQFIDQPVGAILHACRGPVPPGWSIVGTGWNPTVCGHPTTNQPNVMAIKRLN
jgi:hypothetical protein